MKETRPEYSFGFLASTHPAPHRCTVLEGLLLIQHQVGYHQSENWIGVPGSIHLDCMLIWRASSRQKVQSRWFSHPIFDIRGLHNNGLGDVKLQRGCWSIIVDLLVGYHLGDRFLTARPSASAWPPRSYLALRPSRTSNPNNPGLS